MAMAGMRPKDNFVGDLARKIMSCLFPFMASMAHARRGFVEVVLEMFLQGISLSEMEAMMAVARLESGGQLVGDLDQEVMLSWAAMVFLTLQAIGLPMTASGVLHHPSMRMLPRPHKQHTCLHWLLHLEQRPGAALACQGVLILRAICLSLMASGIAATS